MADVSMTTQGVISRNINDKDLAECVATCSATVSSLSVENMYWNKNASAW